jgi:hypothetical protein
MAPVAVNHEAVGAPFHPSLEALVIIDELLDAHLNP